MGAPVSPRRYFQHTEFLKDGDGVAKRGRMMKTSALRGKDERI